jgi:hypothetical protein
VGSDFLNSTPFLLRKNIPGFRAPFFDLNEKWKLTLFLKSCSTITNIRKKPNQSTSKSSPLRDEYRKKKNFEGFFKHNKNFWGSPLFKNSAHFVSLRQKVRLTSTFFENDFFETH